MIRVYPGLAENILIQCLTRNKRKKDKTMIIITIIVAIIWFFIILMSIFMAKLFVRIIVDGFHITVDFLFGDIIEHIRNQERKHNLHSYQTRQYESDNTVTPRTYYRPDNVEPAYEELTKDHVEPEEKTAIRYKEVN